MSYAGKNCKMEYHSFNACEEFSTCAQHQSRKENIEMSLSDAQFKTLYKLAENGGGMKPEEWVHTGGIKTRISIEDKGWIKRDRNQNVTFTDDGGREYIKEYERRNDEAKKR